MTDHICKHCEHYKRSFPLFWLRYCEYGEPYYEVIYHDKYGNTETRIMNPIIASRKVDMNGYSVQEDRFDLNFRRIIRGEEDVRS